MNFSDFDFSDCDCCEVSVPVEDAMVACIENNNFSLVECCLRGDELGQFDSVADRRDFQRIGRALAGNTVVRTLDLCANSVDSRAVCALAAGLAQNTTLQILSLRSCGIDERGAIMLGRALTNNRGSRVRSLNMSANRVGARGASELARAVEMLCLDSNSLNDEGVAAISRVVGFCRMTVDGDNEGAGAEDIQLCRLRTLYLHNNHFGDAGAQELARALVGNTSLTKLSLTHNNISADGAIALGEALLVNTSLQVLSVDHNRGIGDAGGEAILRALSKNNSLRELSLRNTNIGNHSATALGRALEENNALCMVLLSHNRIAVEGMLALIKSLRINGTLQELDICANATTATTADTVRAFGQALADNRCIRRLSIEAMKLNVAAAEELARALSINDTLISLNMEHAIQEVPFNDDAAMVLIGDALVLNTHIRVLNASCSGIGDRGVTAIVRALDTRESALREVKLCGNDMSVVSGCVSALASALATNRDMNRLEMSECKLCPTAVSVMCASLASNRETRLHIWRLDNNCVGDEGATALAALLSSNTSLMSLGLLQCEIGESGACALANALSERNCTLAALDLSGNAICENGTQQLCDALLSNSTLHNMYVSVCTDAQRCIVRSRIDRNRALHRACLLQVACLLRVGDRPAIMAQVHNTLQLGDEANVVQSLRARTFVTHSLYTADVGALILTFLSDRISMFDGTIAINDRIAVIGIL